VSNWKKLGGAGSGGEERGREERGGMRRGVQHGISPLFPQRIPFALHASCRALPVRGLHSRSNPFNSKYY
jgi:hypothetical protein